MGKKTIHRQVYVILDNIRSAHNVGAIFRTADGAGVEKVYLCGYTPQPWSIQLTKAGQAPTGPQAQIAKTALGAEQTVPWEHHTQAWRLIKKLKQAGVVIVALEQSEKSINYKKFKPPVGKTIALILGNEVTGISKTLLAYADAVINIPMRGQKESLNVSVAAGIALYELT